MPEMLEVPKNFARGPAQLKIMCTSETVGKLEKLMVMKLWFAIIS